MSDFLKGQVYLSNEQYQELMNNGSVVVNGATKTYDPNIDYITPDTTLEEAKEYIDAKDNKHLLIRQISW